MTLARVGQARAAESGQGQARAAESGQGQARAAESGQGQARAVRASTLALGFAGCAALALTVALRAPLATMVLGLILFGALHNLLELRYVAGRFSGVCATPYPPGGSCPRRPGCSRPPRRRLPGRRTTSWS